MKAHLVTIGDELLIGQIVDTNSSEMAQMLNGVGISVDFKCTVSDDRDSIVGALDFCVGSADVVIVTGGLGPTKDDRTKQILAEYFGGELEENGAVLEHVADLLGRRGIVLNDENRAQALLPNNCKVLHNEYGTAAGMWFEKHDTVVISIPGVPFEMRHLMKSEIVPRLSEMNGNSAIVHRTVLTQGLPESLLSERLTDWELGLPDFIRLAYLPNPMKISVRLSAYGDDRSQLEAAVEQQIEQLKLIIGDYIFGYDDDNLAMIVGKMLSERGATMGTAESCTGGNIAHQITLNAGSSHYFKGGVVAYSNEIKQRQLFVDAEDLEQHGAVSRAVVEQMAQGVCGAMNCDYGVATSGIAGPGGGTDEKPVGTVWIAVAKGAKVVSKVYNFGGSRERNIVRSTQTALNMLRRLILECDKI